MENFKALVRDTLTIKNPPYTWQLGRNMLISKGFNSIANEDGFKFEYLLPGIAIGAISTSTEIVYFIKNKDGIDEIGKVNTNTNSPVYTTIIKTNLFNFKLNRPIEGVFIYNYKNELTVSWCDGTFEDSNIPKILNTSSPGIKLDGDKTLIDDTEFNKIALFPAIHQGDIEIQYLESGNLNGLSVYITFAYIYEDDTTAPYFSVSDIAYLSDGSEIGNKKGLRLILNNLDTNFTKIKIGLVLKKDNVLVGYESYPITYINGSRSIDITTISNFTSTAAENIIIEKQVFERIASLTKVENQVIAAKTTTKEPIKFQKYANLLILKPIKYIDDAPQTPSLMPDEVYAMSCQVQYLDGTFSDAFHIPGAKANLNDKSPLTAQQKTDYKLNFTDNIVNGGIKQFHIFNRGSATSTNRSFGIWENEELYPNVDDYNSSIDYKNIPIINNFIVGEDLRNTPIRYHRVPGLDNMLLESMVLFNGYYEEFTNSNNLEDTTFYKIGVDVSNFDSVVPQSIKDQIQGYRLCFIKRDGSNNYVAGNWIATRRGQVSWTQADVEIKFQSYDFNASLTGGNFGRDGIALEDAAYIKENPELRNSSNPLYTAFSEPYIDFDKIRVLSPELFKFRPNLDLTYIKNNYLFTVDENRGVKLPTKSNIFAEVKNGLKYVPGNNLVANTMYHEEGIDLDFNTEGFNSMYTSGDKVTDPLYSRYYVMNLTVFSYKTNLYPSFKSIDLVVLGRTSNLGNNVIFKGGDVFNNNIIDINIHTPENHRYGNGRRVIMQYLTKIKIKGLFSPLNSSQLFNNYIEGDEGINNIGDNERSYRIQEDILQARDYDFEVKNENDLNAINDINTIFTFDHNSNFITNNPFRINRGIKIPNENLSSTALRTFLINDYYEMPNDKGEIIAVRGTARKLFIQMRFSLFVASVKDKLQLLNTDAYLGQSDLFDRSPDELLGDDKGYVGSVSKFACIVIKGMYVTVNSVSGKIFIVTDSVKEISAIGNENWFRNNWDIGLDFYRLENEEKRRIDNPYISVGHLVGYDKEYNRLLFTKKSYWVKDQIMLDNGTISFDGEFFRINGGIIDFNNTEYIVNKSKTISFRLDTEDWLFEHDYFPNLIYHDTNNLYSIINNLETKEAENYRHNDKLNKGLFYGKKFPSYVDIIFNGSTPEYTEVTSRNTVVESKMLHSINWVIDTIKPNGGNDQFSGITGIMVYNNNQCSGIINLKNYGELSRSLEGVWSANNFKDLVINPSDPILDDNGDVIESNLNQLKLWFEKSNFISKFIVVRLIIDNIDNNNVYIHKVNVNSIISKR